MRLAQGSFEADAIPAFRRFSDPVFQRAKTAAIPHPPRRIDALHLIPKPHFFILDNRFHAIHG